MPAMIFIGSRRLGYRHQQPLISPLVRGGVRKQKKTETETETDRETKNLDERRIGEEGEGGTRRKEKEVMSYFELEDS